MSDFGTRLRELRTSLDLTVDEFAEKLGTYKSTISRYENGKRVPDVDFVSKISKTFNVSMDWLTGASEDKNISIIQMSSIPELAPVAKGYIKVAQEAYDQGLTPGELQEILQLVLKMRRNSH